MKLSYIHSTLIVNKMKLSLLCFLMMIVINNGITEHWSYESPTGSVVNNFILKKNIIRTQLHTLLNRIKFILEHLTLIIP